MTTKGVIPANSSFRQKPKSSNIPALPFLDSSFRWNDDGVLFRLVYNSQVTGWHRPKPNAPIVIPAQAGIQWFLLYIPAQAGMTTKDVIPANSSFRPKPKFI